MFGRIVNGRLSLGEIDKLLPPPTEAPFRFPDLDVDVADTAIALDTAAGRVGLAIEGAGNLANGFRGEMAAISSRLMLSGCAVDTLRAYGDVAINGRRPSLDGPVWAERLLCPEADIDVPRPRLALDVIVPEAFDSWLGEAGVRAPRARFGSTEVGGVDGTIGFSGNSELTRGAVKLGAAEGVMSDFRSSRLSVDGRYAFSPASGEMSFAGDAGARGVVAGGGAVGPAVRALASADGTPLDPLGDALAAALARAARGFDARGSLRLVNGPGHRALRIERLDAASRSGARLAVTDGQGLTYYWPAGVAHADGEFALSGGGFPAVRLSLSQPRAGAPVTGEARVAPFAAGGASLRLAPVRFSPAAGGGTRIETEALLDGPFNDGRVTGLLLPIRGRFGNGGFAFGETCTQVSVRSFRAAGLVVGPTRLPLCPTGRALLWSDGGAIQGDAEIRALRLAGRLGQSPITLAADRVRVGLADSGFTSSNLAIRLGSSGYVSRLDLASLSGTFSSRGVAGNFTGGSGQIGNVPLLLGEARGTWSVLGDDVLVNGAMTVSDAAELPRFHPLVTNDFRLTLDDGRISVSGWLQDPGAGTRVTRAEIAHDLAAGTGNAVLDVPGITFAEAYQPEELTRLTIGVVALVRGTVQGKGRIDWSPRGVTSTGTFSTENMDLAANFGPVTGLTTTIEFTDLLGLETAPGQRARVGRIQTGVDVFDGEIRYQLLPDLRARVESGRWPFAGGDLILDETILDFSRPSAKHLTFRVVGLDAARFVQMMEFTNISATGTFDGIVPMIFDERGGRIVGGRLEARLEGGTLSYIGELTDKDLGVYGKLAFDALKSLRYDKLDITLDGSLEGEFVTQIELDGIATNTEPLGGIAGAIAGQVAKIPFEFNITVRGPFRALLATARSLEDPSILIQSVLPDILKDQPVTTTIQPEESETVQ